MKKSHISVLAPLCLVATVGAQVVSPVGFANVESTGNNTFPFNAAAFTYQQVHGDIRGTPRPITAFAFRRDGTLTSAYAARTVTVDVFMGDADFAAITNTFATNFVSTPTQVVTNRSVNLPDHSAIPIALPAPFTAVVNLDTPYVHTGVLDLCWDLRLTSNSGTGSYPMDAASGTGVVSTNGTATQLGTGCTTSTGTMELRWTGSTTATQFNLRWAVRGGPASAQTSVLVGNPVAIPLPSLCTPIQTDGTFFSLGGTTATGGTFTSALVTVPYNPAFVGIPLAAQAASLDASQPGLPLALSNGLLNTIAGPVTGPVLCARIYSSGNATALTGTLGNNYSLVTELR